MPEPEDASRQESDSGANHVVCVLVCPTGAINPRTGAGQRTRIFFEALREAGPVSVLILAAKDCSGPDEFFPGAQEVRQMRVSGYAPPPQSAVLRQAHAFWRLMNPASTLGLQKAATEGINILTEGADASLIVFRYLRPAATSGIFADASRARYVVVDVDDRDDLKAQLQLRQRLGRFLTHLISPFLIKRLRDRMIKVLNGASLVYFAKPQDRLVDVTALTRISPNVPFYDLDDSDLTKAGEDEVVLFVGSFGHFPNQDGVRWFLDNCWPRVLKARPDAEFRIVGLGTWCEFSGPYRHLHGVTFVGAVETVHDEYHRARVVICPLREGAGSQIKLIEGCSFARPVISTRMSSTGFGEAIEAEIDKTDDTEEFAAAVVSYLADRDAAVRKGERLRELQQKEFSRKAVISRLKNDFRTRPSPSPSRK